MSCSCDAIKQLLEEMLAKRGKRGKRKRTPRDEFMSTCMKATPGPVTERMKSCSAEWKAKNPK